MSSEGVIKLKGDNSQLDAATEKSKLNFEKLGQHASKANGHAKSFGEQWQHANGHMIRTIAHGVSIVAVLERAVEHMVELQEKAKDASKAVGEISVSRDRAASALGISNRQAEGLVGGDSPVSLEDRTKFFASLATKKFGRAKQKLTPQQTAVAQSAYNSGLYQEGEIDQAFEKGDLGPLGHAGERFNALSPESRAALATDRYVNAQKEAAEQARSGRGNYYRAAEANFDLDTARHPFSVKSVLSGLPVIGAAGKAYYNEKVANGNGTLAPIKDAIDAQTELMHRDARRPTVAKPAE